MKRAGWYLIAGAAAGFAGVLGLHGAGAATPSSPGPLASGGAGAAPAPGLAHCDALFSTWDAASPVSRFRRGAAALSQLPGEFGAVLQECHVAKEAQGAGLTRGPCPGGSIRP